MEILEVNDDFTKARTEEFWKLLWYKGDTDKVNNDYEKNSCQIYMMRKEHNQWKIISSREVRCSE